MFRRIKSPDQNVLVLSQRWEKRGPKQKEGLNIHGEHSSVSTKSALNPSACWPEATLDVGLDCLSLSEK